MELNNGDGKAKVIAYYLPQFYPCEFNDKWYGKGFTEWTNVGKAKSLFKGHKQPRVPADLGYYDLRVPEVAEQQVVLAKEAGLFGFAYWHYWWAGERLLDMPAERMLSTQKPDFPFMFAWANENWYKKLWKSDSTKDTLIREQTYPGEEDNRQHFEYCLPFFKDSRYITYNGRPVFLIYHPLHFPAIKAFMDQWDSWIKKENLADSFYWMAVASNKEREYNALVELGFDCINFAVEDIRKGTPPKEDTFAYNIWLWKQRFYHFIYRRPTLVDYETMIETIWQEKFDSKENVAPVLIPQWDHSPRSGLRSCQIYDKATPGNFYKQAINVLSHVSKKDNKIVMLKSWNEWGEGNYMEPDLLYGKGFIEALSRAVSENSQSNGLPKDN